MKWYSVKKPSSGSTSEETNKDPTYQRRFTNLNTSEETHKDPTYQRRFTNLFDSLVTPKMLQTTKIDINNLEHAKVYT